LVKQAFIFKRFEFFKVKIVRFVIQFPFYDIPMLNQKLLIM